MGQHHVWTHDPIAFRLAARDTLIGVCRGVVFARRFKTRQVEHDSEIWHRIRLMERGLLVTLIQRHVSIKLEVSMASYFEKIGRDGRTDR